MNLLQGLAAAAAVVVAVGPQLRQAAAYVASLFMADPNVPAPKPLDEVVAPSYRDAIGNLAAVRLRLKATGKLDDDQKQAIDVLTLALVDGSDE